jgi:hypothetical protein
VFGLSIECNSRTLPVEFINALYLVTSQIHCSKFFTLILQAFGWWKIQWKVTTQRFSYLICGFPLLACKQRLNSSTQEEGDSVHVITKQKEYQNLLQESLTLKRSDI